MPEDQQECVRRLGWLNIFDSMQPDRQFPPLDLSVRDERELVQILAQLALNEGVRASHGPYCMTLVDCESTKSVNMLCSKRHGKSLLTTTRIELSRGSLDRL